MLKVLIKFTILQSIFIIFWVTISSNILMGQTGKPPVTTINNQTFEQDSLNKKISLHNEDNQIVDATSLPATQYLNGNVRVFHSNTFMYCDTAILKGPLLRMRHNVVMLQNDTIKIFADSLIYNADSLVAYIYGDIILENGQKKLYTSELRYEVNNKIGSYSKNAKLVDGTSNLISRKGVYRLNDKQATFKENVVVTGEDFKLITDSLIYQTETQMTTYPGPVRILKDTSEIYSEKGWFDLDDQRGDFIQNAQYLSGTTRAEADTISYDGALDIVTLKSIGKLSKYYSEKDTAIAQIITYDKKNEAFTLKGDAYYKSKDNEVKGMEIFYDKKEEKFKTEGRSTVSDPPMIITSDQLDYSKKSKYGIADGEVIWQDTSAKTTVYADHLRYKGEDNYMIAYNDVDRPMFTSLVGEDTLYLKADTLRSFRILTAIDSLTTDTTDYFVGERNVRMFKNDMQMICDSLNYNLTDSIFTFFRNPYVWSDSTQIAGDTIQIFMKNKNIDQLNVLSNGTVISSDDLVFFNQIKGRQIECSFVEGKMRKMFVDGNAEVVYYLTDSEKAYIGVNRTESSYVHFLMADNKITDIRFYTESTSNVVPMGKADHEKLKVKGFYWNMIFRPLSIDDL